MSLVLRKAHGKDVVPMHSLIVAGAEKGLLLPRSRGQIFTALRDFFVLADEETGGVAGCCALAIIWENLAEVRSLYVADTHRRQGLGQKLVNACLEDAASFGITQVFTLTYQTAFFKGLGFAEVPKETLPQKIWTDCIHCPKFPNCDEIALIRSV
ncbi:putative acetyltransferase [uncultured delta proteobacterium]|uniref:Putative acetyltransferase n=1 Tax=uncultured delta proteobacterium TaxID=34034 RepID=A0A212J584_9DELT|nr:putative acetyltransferase [uncultured delta proteobacterium]